MSKRRRDWADPDPAANEMAESLAKSFREVFPDDRISVSGGRVELKVSKEKSKAPPGSETGFAEFDAAAAELRRLFPSAKIAVTAGPYRPYDVNVESRVPGEYHVDFYSVIPVLRHLASELTIAPSPTA